MGVAAVKAAEFTPKAFKRRGFWFAHVWHPNHGKTDNGAAVSHMPHLSKTTALNEARDWIAKADNVKLEA